MTVMRLLTLVPVLLALAACGGGADGDGGEQPPAAGAPIPSGGLSVAEAIASDLEGPLAVRGYVIARDDEYRLCEAILESDPPQCGEPSLRIDGPSFAELRKLSDTAAQVSLLGDVEGGVIRVSETST
jgi:hypothetical protein